MPADDERRPADDEAATALRERLRPLSPADREGVLVDLVGGLAATVLGHGGDAGLEPDRAFREVGFDSMTAVELRNRLRAATGVHLPAAVVFDYPTPAALARHLRDRLAEDGAAAAAPLLAELERLDGAFAAEAPDRLTRQKLLVQLQAFVARWGDERGPAEEKSATHTLDDATDAEIFDFIHRELGGPGGNLPGI
ncbi:acyl carrier protein [Micromonospora aurantiaca (nom. illeg.)]